MGTKIPFHNFQELYRNLQDREIVLFGRGNIATKTTRKLDRSFSFLVDNNPNMWDTIEHDKDVLNPSTIKDKSDKYFIIICTMSFQDVTNQLENFGYIPEKDFIVSPLLNDLRVISEMENMEKKMLFTCSTPQQDDPQCGGGIYELILDGHSWDYKKIYSGTCQGILKHNDKYITVDDTKGIIELDKDYNLISTKKLPQSTRGHGIAYSEITDSFYIVSTYKDEILILNSEYEQTDTIKLSDKFVIEGEAAHHCNDICIVGRSIYVTMFSYSGNWKKDIFDGVILEIDLTTKEIKTPIVRDLWMPHNVSFIDGSITVLDSLRGELKKNNAQPVGRFPGFSRGLAFDGIYYFIGQSRNRNYSKNLGVSLNISIDVGIIIFDEKTKASRTIHLPQKLSEVHSILLLD